MSGKESARIVVPTRIHNFMRGASFFPALMCACTIALRKRSLSSSRLRLSHFLSRLNAVYLRTSRNQGVFAAAPSNPLFFRLSQSASDVPDRAPKASSKSRRNRTPRQRIQSECHSSHVTSTMPTTLPTTRPRPLRCCSLRRVRPTTCCRFFFCSLDVRISFMLRKTRLRCFPGTPPPRRKERSQKENWRRGRRVAGGEGGQTDEGHSCDRTGFGRFCWSCRLNTQDAHVLVNTTLPLNP